MEIETIMIIAFAAALGLSLWKLYAFFPKKRLADDDTTSESVDELTTIVIQSIVQGHNEQGELTHEELFLRITTHTDFDKEHYWRFNHNRLNQLLRSYYLEFPHTDSLKTIYLNEKKSE